MNKGEIPIFFAIDDKYVPYLDIAVRSLMENASKEYNYEIKVLHHGLNDKQMNNIKNLTKNSHNFNIDLIYVKEGLESITNREENWLRYNHFTLSIYFRIFIADIFPQYDKGIYIDSDIVVPGDISELFNIELGNNIIGAVNDCTVTEHPVFAKYVEEAVGINKNEYINSGVLLMNLKQMREKGFSKNFLRLLNTYHFDSVAPDQDYINAMCNGNILYLDETWDAMPNNNREPLKEPKLIHYNMFFKPWYYDNVQYEEYFWNYAKKSIYYNDILDKKNKYSSNQVEEDKKGFDILIEKADNMPNRDITFRKVFESGEKFGL